MSGGKSVDPLTLSLIEGRLNSLNQELGARVLRQGFSPIIVQIRDFGTVLFDKQERTVTVGNWMAVHTAGAHVCLKGMLDWIGRDNIHPDYFILANDPFIVRFGHAPDWSFIRPIEPSQSLYQQGSQSHHHRHCRAQLHPPAQYTSYP